MQSRKQNVHSKIIMFSYILRKIIKIVAINYQILRLKSTRFNFGSGSALKTRSESDPQTFRLNLRGLYSHGKGGVGKEGRGGVRKWERGDIV